MSASLLIGLCAAALLAAPTAPARSPDEAEFTSTVDREEIGLDETVRLDLTVTLSSKGDQGELVLPALKDFDVVGRSSAEQASFTFSGGAPAFRRTTVTSLTLSPHKAGTLTIEPARLTFKGHTFVTGAIPVRVLASGQSTSRRARRRPDPAPDDPNVAARAQAARNSEGSDPFEGIRASARDLTLKASVDVEQPTVGQQVTYSLWLLARVSVSGIDKLQLPKMDGFWTEEVEAPQQLVGEARVIDGVPMQAFLLRKRALFPLRPGKVVIEPAEVEVITGMGMLFSRSNVKRETQAITVEVQPLPAGRPPGFDQGNVGQWALNATAEPLAVAVGQPVTLRLTVSGRGNLRDLQLPRLPSIPGLRAYDATSTDKANVEQGKVGGTRTVEQLLVPERTGDLDIPPLSLETFDPLSKQYKTLRTAPIHLTAAAAQAGAQGASSGAGTAQNLLAAGGLRPIRLRLHRGNAGTPPWEQPWFFPLLLAAPLLLGGALGALRLGRVLTADPDKQRQRLAADAARKRLRTAEQLLARQKSGGEVSAEFYAEVARALGGYLSDKQGLSVAGLTREELARSLADRGHSKVTVEKLAAVLDECDRARFAPGARTAAAQEAVLQRADAVLTALDGARKEAA